VQTPEQVKKSRNCNGHDATLHRRVSFTTTFLNGLDLG